MPSERFHFEEFELDRSAYQLRCDGEVVRLERLPLDLLFLLVELRGQLVTREQIIDRLWGKDVFVDSDSGINTAVRKIRQALRDDTNAPRFVVTVPAKGYRFAASVVATNGEVRANDQTFEVVPLRDSFIPGRNGFYEKRWLSTSGPWRAAALVAVAITIVAGTKLAIQHRLPQPPPMQDSTLPPLKVTLVLPGIPSIAVLPFANLSGDPEQEYFSDGITDDLVTDLSRLPGLFVIDRNSTFAYKGKTPRVQEVGRELGVKFVLEGSARRAADRVRIDVQLVDASTGNQIWSQRYDRQLVDVFALQDEIVRSLVRTLNLQFMVRQKGFAFPQRTKNLEAYDYFLRGVEYLMSPMAPDRFAQANRMFEKAIELDPTYPEPYGTLSFLYFLSFLYQWDKDPGVLDRSTSLAKKAIALDDSASMVYALLAWIAASRAEWDMANAYSSRALALEPNNAFICLALAYVRRVESQPMESIAFAQKGMRLDPVHSGAYWGQEGFAYNEMGRFADALEAFKRSDQSDPTVHLSLIWTYSRLGRAEDERAEVAELMHQSPHFSLESFKQMTPYDWKAPGPQAFLAELRRVGLK
jgi:TolB-like protein/DNA-binding winged helix-turn-helix (wHTH) protein